MTARRNSVVSDFKRAAKRAQCEVCRWRPPEALRVVEEGRGILHAHHVFPVACGGPDTAENLILVCPSCHVIAHRLGRMIDGGADAKVWSGPQSRRELFACFAILKRPSEFAVLAKYRFDYVRYIEARHAEAETMNNPHRGLFVIRGATRRFA